MNLINLTTINENNFRAILDTLICTGNEIEFANPTKEHESIALGMGLTTILLEDSKETTLIVRDEDEDINSWI
ncbi:MAG: hypothetical protein Unbinned2716contig1000_47 [Prokaryotic dsDNA virus sp.]|nr:MAG: hypothetical protein Unbinned2716contig1000_47 [Prokaryotic dsDNA virus sp.]|tara:strand:+ start:6972 stop:7190 length:219 start_codon:yes stop_codon:yes gene_type:complete